MHTFKLSVVQEINQMNHSKYLLLLCFAEQEVVLDPDELMTISIQAFTGITKYQTIGVTGYHEKMPLQVQKDTGSAHNFIDQEVAKRSGCQANSIDEQFISLVDKKCHT